MNNFDDVRNDLKNENPSLFFTLEIVGELMAAKDRKGISQRELSRLSGVAQKTISRMENGIDVPTLETLGKLANALGMSIVLVDNQED
ncbi:helix-turn-helix domain-containing protein [Bacillus sp. UMB0728]|uniref:helix-turn-helix domain-containing protein n=1 Tax=Bacillus sp. UMB0728 TaxID=2066052 RepID=UPI000C7905A0|nr:helix-turn-helix transcriptional regulator [Bacillus sp. UMB0728]PLR72270.1 XRE family transcriptional regulator [Bacillus sp. UMB0728]